MKRTTLTASLVGSAAAGLLAAALATPALAQATTYPEGTDCSAIQNSANRTDCMTQQNESRQNQVPGSGSDVTPGTGTGAPNSSGDINNSNTVTPGSTPNNGQGPATGAGGSSGTNGAGTSQ